MVDRSDRWDGGYRRVAKNGRKVFVIYARRAGKLYEISTRATSSAAAQEHWRRFQSDPENYKPQGEAPRGALVLDQDLGRAFLDWSTTKGNSPKWIRDQRRALNWWRVRLAGGDLRALRTSQVLAELEPVTAGRKQLIATLKAFYGWLRKERHLIDTAQDPMFGQVRVPQARVAQQTKTKAIAREEYAAALGALEGWPRDALEVLGATGWHTSELARFAAGGAVERHPITEAPVLYCPRTKRGNELRTQVDAGPAAAARRLLDHGRADYFALHRALRAVGATFSPGHMRHSVATWAVNAGADPGAVAAFLNHRSLATTRKFYATHAVPAKVPTLA